MLFKSGNFTSHSGLELSWKIDCDALTDDDLATLAIVVSQTLAFKDVHGVPTGGLRFAEALRRYIKDDDRLPTLIVDDVLTTGKSMEDMKKSLGCAGEICGVVIFARPGAKVPPWIEPLFWVSPYIGNR